MAKVAFIFPGQGAQKVGMGKSFYDNSPLAREIFEQAEAVLGFDVKALCFEENDLLDQTEYTQAAMVTTCLAMEACVREAGICPDVTAGLSLGEYCAIVSAGGMSVKDGVRTVRQRGILMEHAVPNGKGAMAAVLGMASEEIEKILSYYPEVSIANYNCPGQIVITGETSALQQASEELGKAGARRILPLNVSGPFHSPLLRPAGEELEKVLETVDFMPLEIPYVTNVTANYVTEIEETKALLSEQVSSPVRWQQSMEKLIADGINTFVEIGPGNTLTGFMKKINKQMTVYRISEWEDLQELIRKGIESC